MLERNFGEDTKINRFKLEEECEKHPGIYYIYMEALADARIIVDKRKDKLELISSEVYLNYSGMDKLPNGSKTTGENVKAYVNKDEKVQSAKKKLLEAKSDLSTLEAAGKALEHKKSQLDNLRHLWISGYYSDPNRKRGRTDEAGNEIRKQLNKE